MPGAALADILPDLFFEAIEAFGVQIQTGEGSCKFREKSVSMLVLGFEMKAIDATVYAGITVCLLGLIEKSKSRLIEGPLKEWKWEAVFISPRTFPFLIVPECFEKTVW